MVNLLQLWFLIFLSCHAYMVFTKKKRVFFSFFCWWFNMGGVHTQTKYPGAPQWKSCPHTVAFTYLGTQKLHVSTFSKRKRSWVYSWWPVLSNQPWFQILIMVGPRYWGNYAIFEGRIGNYQCCDLAGRVPWWGSKKDNSCQCKNYPAQLEVLQGRLQYIFSLQKKGKSGCYWFAPHSNPLPRRTATLLAFACPVCPLLCCPLPSLIIPIIFHTGNDFIWWSGADFFSELMRDERPPLLYSSTCLIGLLPGHGSNGASAINKPLYLLLRLLLMICWLMLSWPSW